MTKFIQPCSNVRAIIARQGLKHRDIAQGLGLSNPAFSGRVNGTIDFRAAELLELSYLLEVSVSEFFEDCGFIVETARLRQVI